MMLSVERLGVLLAPRDKEHAKFNAGMVKQGDIVHMLYRWSRSTEIWTGEKTGVLYAEDGITGSCP